MSEPVEVRTERAALELARRDPRVVAALTMVGMELPPRTAPARLALVATNVLAAEALVWLYRYGYRLGWDSLKAVAQIYQTHVRTMPYGTTEEQARELARMCIEDGHAWPAPTLPGA